MTPDEARTLLKRAVDPLLAGISGASALFSAGIGYRDWKARQALVDTLHRQELSRGRLLATAVTAALGSGALGYLVGRKAAPDHLSGGKADGRRPEEFDAKALAEGEKHEREHTQNPALAREIAMDHLAEDPRYYQKLRKVEKKADDAVGKGDDEEPGGAHRKKLRELARPVARKLYTTRGAKGWDVLTDAVVGDDQAPSPGA